MAIVGWFPTLNLVCNCEAKQPMLVVGFSNVSTCPHCGRGFQLHGVRQDVRTGEPPHFDLNIIVPRPAAADTSKNGSSEL